MQQDEPTSNRRAALSALMDGDRAAVDPACGAWRDDPQAREDWHTYHLIGDLLRSDDQVCRPAHDAAFLAGVRQRLASEPVVLAPEPPAGRQHAQARRRRAWALSGAVAAGFAAVAGVLVVVRATAPDAAGDRLAGAATSPTGATAIAVAASAGAGTWPEQATLIRNSDLDRYLAAHRQYSASTLALPGGAVRNVSLAEPAR